MSKKLKILFAPLVAGFILIFFSIIYAENGLIDLLRIREKKNFLKIENSKIGLKLFGEIDTFKRLAKNDLKLIDRLARQQGMVGKNELVLIPSEPIKNSKNGKSEKQSPDNFRILSEDEIDELLKFDIESFRFYEELKENDQKQFSRNKKESDEKISPVPKGEISGKIRNITIQVAAFKDRKHAERMAKKLNQKGYHAFIVTGKSSGNVTLHRVRIGNFRNEKDAQTIIGRLKKDKFKPIIIKN